MSVYLRWLGVAGVEVQVGGQTLIIDPYFTRFPFWRMWLGRVQPDRALIAQHVTHGDHVLITHPHWDHIMDVPEVARRTGAVAYGSANACGLLAALGVSAGQVRHIEAGDRLALGAFGVEVLPALHTRTPADRRINGPLRTPLKPPLRAFDYRMDTCFSFLVEAEGQRLLVGTSEDPAHAVPADVLFVGPLGTRDYVEGLLRRVQPRTVIPYHWDDMFRPLAKPLRPMLEPPRLAIPPLRRMNLTAFTRRVEEMAPGTRVVVPEVFRRYDVSELV